MKKFLAAFVLTIMMIPALSHAENSKPHFIIYQGRVTDGMGEPITNLMTLRFSLWENADAVPMDQLADGSFNMTSKNTVYWYEQYLVTPDKNGEFAVALGSQIENRFNSKMFLQIDIKEINGEFQILDMFSDPAIDRQSVAFMMTEKVNLINEAKTFRVEQNLMKSEKIKTLAMGDVLNDALDMNPDTKAITLNPKKKIYGSFIANEYCNPIYGACFAPGEEPAIEEEVIVAPKKSTLASMLQATLFSPSAFSSNPQLTTSEPEQESTTNEELLKTIRLLQKMIVDLNIQIRELKAQE